MFKIELIYLLLILFLQGHGDTDYIICLAVFCYVNPPMYKQSHTLTVVQGGGGGVDGPPFGFSLCWQYFEKISPLVESLLCALT